MAVLRENRSYGLSGKLSRGENVSVFHVKLTDSAAKAIDSFRNAKGWSTHPTISFRGSQGSITIPCSERDQLRIFTFGLTNVASDKLQGTFDCVQQPGGTSSSEELLCLGVIQKKLKVDATDESYARARQSMAQAEEETRSQGAIVIKGVGRERDRGKKVLMRASGSEPAAKAKPLSLPQTQLTFTRRRFAMSKQKKSPAASNSQSTGEVKERPLKERLIHLLVLRPYKRSELLLRLQKDGLTDRDGGGLDAVLKEVGDLSCSDNTFVLKNSLFQEVQKDWPGYTSGELQLLKRILVRRLFEPQQNLLAVPQIQVSPLRETPNSSPVHQQNPSKPEAYTDPLVKRRPRISHLSKKTASELPRVAKHMKRTDAAEATQKRSSLEPRRLFGSIEGPGPKSDGPPPSVRGERPRMKRKRSEQEDRRKDKDTRKGDQSSEETNVGDSADSTDPAEILLETNANQADSDTDYLETYSVVSSSHQRQSYKQEFNQDYSEYRLLHARIDGVTQQFMELNTQLQQLSRESCKYKEVHDQIIQAYRKIKKSNPNYQQEKVRCEYLHNKLAHIKKLISAYDQQQLLLDDTSVKKKIICQEERDMPAGL